MLEGGGGAEGSDGAPLPRGAAADGAAAGAPPCGANIQCAAKDEKDEDDEPPLRQSELLKDDDDPWGQGDDLDGLDLHVRKNALGAASAAQWLLEWPFSLARWLTIPSADESWGPRKRRLAAATPACGALLLLWEVRARTTDEFYRDRASSLTHDKPPSLAARLWEARTHTQQTSRVPVETCPL
jgi:hypothetical protein